MTTDSDPPESTPDRTWDELTGQSKLQRVYDATRSVRRALSKHETDDLRADEQHIKRLDEIAAWMHEQRGAQRVVLGLLSLVVVALLSWGTWITLATLDARAQAQTVQWRLDHPAVVP